MIRSDFIGRKRELALLEGLTRKNSASLVTLKGRRRIGKSRLVEEFAKGKRFFVFTGTPLLDNTNATTQRQLFAQQLGQHTGFKALYSDDWSDLFSLLARQTQEGEVVILFDEISWMGSKDPTFLGKLKNAWDLEFQKNPKLILIICGSVSTWIEENIIKSTAFFGRVSLYLTLDELDLQESNQFLNQQNFYGSSYERFKILAIMGGVPWYLQQISKSYHANEIVKDLCFRKEGILFNEFDRIFHDLFDSRGKLYKEIVQILVDGPKEYSEISQVLKYEKGGGFSRYLEDLLQSGFIARDYTWNLKAKNPSRLSRFRLKDNYLRFYLKFIYPHTHQIEKDRFQMVELEQLPGYKTMLGLQFENLVLKNRSKIWQALRLNPADIVMDNPFFQRHTKIAQGCQIDYLIQTRFNTLFVCEIKFSSIPVTSKIIPEMKEKISRLALPRNFSCWPVLIHANGVDDALEESQFFTEIIDFSKFLDC